MQHISDRLDQFYHGFTLYSTDNACQNHTSLYCYEQRALNISKTTDFTVSLMSRGERMLMLALSRNVRATHSGITQTSAATATLHRHGFIRVTHRPLCVSVCLSAL